MLQFRSTTARWIPLTLIVAFLAACSSSSEPSTPGVTGQWHLRTVNGQALPHDQGAGFAILSDDITFSGDGSYVDLIRSRRPNASDTTYRYTGTWIINGTTVTGMGSTTGNLWTTDWQIDSLVNRDPAGSRYVYRR